MGNIVAKSNNGCIHLDLGVYKDSPYNLKSPFVILKSNIEEFYINSEGGIEFITRGRNNHTMYLSSSQKAPFNGKIPYLIVDSVNDVVPTDENHLLELIYNCFG